MKKLFALAVLTALILAAPAVRADQAGARERLEKEGLAFTPEAFLQKVAEGDAEHVKLFLEAGIDPSVRNASNRTALWVATERRQIEVVKTLFQSGVKPDEKNAPAMEGGKSLVFEAVDSENTELLRLLVEAGADAKSGNDYEVTPLGEAARTGRLEMCQILIKAGADPNAAPGGFPLIYGPVNENHLEVVRLLIEAGAKLGEHKAALVEAAQTPEMRAVLEGAE
jgi:ankyrin repeat protein